MRLATLTAGLVLCVVPAAAAGPFTLEQIMSKPFPESLTAGPGGRLAWVVNQRGARNIWVAEPPAYRGRALTRFTADDGQEISQLAWLPDATGVLYIRGGDFEHGLADPNPLSRPEGVEQVMWQVALAGDVAPRRLTTGNTPIPVPASQRILFLRKQQIWSLSADAPEKAEQLVSTRGRVTSLVLSPDASAMAFTCDRGDHGFVGIYRFAEKDVRWMDPGVDSDIFPVWSPDSRRVAFVRIPSLVSRARGAVRSLPQPWSIRVADAATGVGRQVWRAAAGKGSAFRGTVGAHQVMWAAGDVLVFPWERDGWTHLYSVSIDGGVEAALLTPGDFEVEHVALSPSRAEVVYSSNQGDIDRRHLWRVALGADGGAAAPRQVTSGAGIEWAPAPLAGSAGDLAYLASNARSPAGARVLSGQRTIELAPETVPAGFPKDALVEAQPVMISAADGMAIHAQLFLPRDSAAAGGGGRHPAVIFFHGGSRRQMLLGWHYMYYYNNAYAMNQYLASQGYVVLSVNYRSGTGYGLDFREALNYGASGASEFNDVLGAGLYLRGRPDVDPKRIGLWGGSYGGYLTALGLARASDLFAAGVDMHGVHNWAALGSGGGRNPAGSDQQAAEAARKAFESSPMASIKTWRSPVLLIHGDDDRNVPFSETVRLVEALRNQRVEFEQLIFPDEIHDFLTQAHWTAAYAAAADFFARKLK
jgi:dipeptidyl aminopeptidase/acylaminoacyl peptidase